MSRSASFLRLVFVGAAAYGGFAFLRARRGADAAPGKPKSLSTAALETGTWALQPRGPLPHFNTYLVGLHPMKHAPSHQMVAHHFCQVVNEDFMQCVLFDGAHDHARLTGVEYIISERLFETLPDNERPYWHPHNYEILSGTLAAPGVPRLAETAFMKKKMNSYGKTWHFWMTGAHGDPLPFGEPQLAWSFNHDEEIPERLLSELTDALDVDVAGKRRAREGLARFAHPQRGVCTLQAAFPEAHTAPPGIEEARP